MESSIIEPDFEYLIFFRNKIKSFKLQAYKFLIFTLV